MALVRVVEARARADTETWAAYEAALTTAREDDGLRAQLEAILAARARGGAPSWSS